MAKRRDEESYSHKSFKSSLSRCCLEKSVKAQWLRSQWQSMFKMEAQELLIRIRMLVYFFNGPLK